MRLVSAIGMVLKALFVLVFFFWEVSVGTSGDHAMHKVLRSEQIQPIPNRIKNELSDFEDFEHLEAGIAFLLGKFDIKGASVAVAKDGKLVYAKGIGYANVEAEEPVEPRHQFRIASVSKLITATTIMKMAEEGMLSIDDRVFGKNGLLDKPEYQSYSDRRIERITVRHLLNHSGGWNSRFGDQMNRHHLIARELKIDISDVEVVHLVANALKDQLHFDPGTRTSYSNLGYAILGEVIAEIAGMDYEEYVREKVLQPLGIHEMRIGRNYLWERFENEVKYYDLADSQRFHVYRPQIVPKAYGGNNIETLGAAGGWIATPAEILKLVVAIDTINGQGFLSPESVKLMTNPALSGGHTIGWAGTDGQGNWWRTGSLAGTSALVMRQNDGISWAVLFNSSSTRDTNMSREITREMKAALNQLEEWPDHDLFYHFDPPPFLYPELAMLR